MLKARDIMTTDVISVKKDTPILDAVELLIDNEITGVPVVEEDMTLLGILTEKDVLRLFYTQDQEKNKTVGDFMTRPAVYYHDNESLQTICDFMVINYFRRVPVISKGGKLVGIISRPDVLKYVLQLSRGTVNVG
ncbi:MAG TPA: CBS domain-containing protein [Sedimentisphaerales bacterium]|nr:CBS domain-containing protein [Sedimentisphaerales bacterium]